MQALQDRTALVTGASSGIGAATARALAAHGARVVLAARRAERLEALVQELPGASAVELDVCDPAAVTAALDGVNPDLAILNAGLALGTEPLAAGSVDEWSTVFDTNVKGVLHCARAVLPGMLERGRGDLVLVGSVAGRQVYPGGAVYCASKHAVRALYEGMRIDCVGSGVRFTTVDPGLVETEFSLVRFRGDAERAAAVYQGVEALAPRDVADAILYAVTRPPHVNVGELVLWPTAQASTTLVDRHA